MKALKKYFKRRKNAITEILKKISSSYAFPQFSSITGRNKKDRCPF